MLRTLQKNNQLILLGILLLVWLVFGIINPQILTISNFYSLTRASIIPAIFVLAEMLMMALGGIDISYAMVAACSSYCTFYIWTQVGWSGNSVIPFFLIAILIAVVLQMINWFFIDRVNLNSFIATLGVQSALKGFVLAFVSTAYIYRLPNSIQQLGQLYLDRAVSKDGVESVLHSAIILVIVLYVAMYFLLEKTKLGREIYAIGGDVDSARRAGINVSKVRLYCLIISGIICGIGGVLHDALSRASMPLPTDYVGRELNSIAAIVIGIGGSKKARGMVSGTLLGVLLLQTISTNLVMLGVPSFWQQAVSGIIILAGMIAQTVNSSSFEKMR